MRFLTSPGYSPPVWTCDHVLRGSIRAAPTVPGEAVGAGGRAGRWHNEQVLHGAVLRSAGEGSERLVRNERATNSADPHRQAAIPGMAPPASW